MTEPKLNRARPGRATNAKGMSPKDAKAVALKALRDGASVKDAMALTGRLPSTYIQWRKDDAAFKSAVDQLREIANAARRRGEEGATIVPDFPEFSETYLGHTLPTLHMRTWDMMNGREPRDLHPSMTYNKGRKNLLLINYPPDHGKSTTWSVNFPTYQIISNPATRGAIISKTGNLARQFLGAIKYRLENPTFSDLQKAFSPEGGFQGESWTQSAIYVGGRNSGEKDPTVQALGMGSAVYGARLDWVVLDDCIDTSNAHRFDEQLRWLSTEVLTRLPDGGLVMVLGTRIAPMDLYAKLREMKDYNEEDSLYTYLAQPAVLEGSTRSPEDWVTLWPERWNGPALSRRKATLGSAARWALVYQQQDVGAEATFPAGAVEASINKARAAGNLTGGMQNGLPAINPATLWTVVGVDPATTGNTAMVVAALDRDTGKRIVLDGFNQANVQPMRLKEQIKHFVTTYKAKELIIERNAFQKYLSSDEELRAFCYGQGCVLREHFTSANKHDEDYGVQSMVPLFLSCVDSQEDDNWKRKIGGGLIDLPNRAMSTFTDDLVEQLITWMPKGQKRGSKTDCVMALWFCEIGMKRQLETARGAPRFSNNPFLPKREREQRRTINLNTLRDEAYARRGGYETTYSL